MSDAGSVLTDDDRAVLEYVNEELDRIDSHDDPEVHNAELKALLRRVANAFDKHQRQVETRLDRLEKQIGGGQELGDVPESKLERYLQIPPDEREELLGPSERRALAIVENWDTLARRADAGWVVSTHRNSVKKHNPSQFRLDLEGILGEDLQWIEVYRAMKAVAKLSGGEPEPDQYGRMHIARGTFQYHEKPTPDGQDTYKLLKGPDPADLEGSA